MNQEGSSKIIQVIFQPTAQVENYWENFVQSPIIKIELTKRRRSPQPAPPEKPEPKPRPEPILVTTMRDIFKTVRPPEGLDERRQCMVELAKLLDIHPGDTQSAHAPWKLTIKP